MSEYERIKEEILALPYEDRKKVLIKLLESLTDSEKYGEWAKDNLKEFEDEIK